MVFNKSLLVGQSIRYCHSSSFHFLWYLFYGSFHLLNDNKQEIPEMKVLRACAWCCVDNKSKCLFNSVWGSMFIGMSCWDTTRHETSIIIWSYESMFQYIIYVYRTKELPQWQYQTENLMEFNFSCSVFRTQLRFNSNIICLYRR